MSSEEIALKAQSVYSDIDLLRDCQIYEIEKTRGTPKCSTLANRLKKNVDSVINGYESMIQTQVEAAEESQFNLLEGLLDRLTEEIGTLSKKQPDGLVNPFKVQHINRVLKPLKQIMCNEPSAEFLDYVAEVEERATTSRNSYSDVAVILCQYKEACRKYWAKYYSDTVSHLHFGL